MNITGKHIAALASSFAVIGGLVAAYHHFQTDAEAADTYISQEQNHLVIASDRERGDVENQLQTCELEIKYLLSIQERRPLNNTEIDRLEYLKQLRLILEQRLNAIKESAG